MIDSESFLSRLTRIRCIEAAKSNLMLPMTVIFHMARLPGVSYYETGATVLSPTVCFATVLEVVGDFFFR
jgi:hypothetical protein